MNQLIIYLAMILVVVGGAQSLSLDLERTGPVTQGETVTFTCQASSSDEISMLRWIKKVDDQETEIAINTYVNGPYRERYHAGVDYNAQTQLTFTLEIQDVQATDTGEIGCRALPSGPEVFETLVIQTKR